MESINSDQQFGEKKESFGSKIMKIIFLLGIVVLVIVAVLAVLNNEITLTGAITYIVGGIIGIFVVMLALRGLQNFFKGKPFSPQTSLRTTMIQIAKKGKPRNIKNLYLRGEDMRLGSKYGQIWGLAFMPYVTSDYKLDEKGNKIQKMEYKGKTEDGTEIYKPVFNLVLEGEKKVKKPVWEKEIITEKDGDVLFIVPKHKFPINLIMREVQTIRVNPKYCSDLLGDVYIKDVNFMPIGDYFYPAKQYQNDIIRIMKQDQSETIIQTHKYFLDLTSWVTQMSIGSDPTFQKMMFSQAENLQQSQGFMPPQQ